LVRVCVSVVPTIDPVGADFPPIKEAFKSGTTVSELTVNGAVPEVIVEINLAALIV
jgi:hypothetical protein